MVFRSRRGGKMSAIRKLIEEARQIGGCATIRVVCNTKRAEYVKRALGVPDDELLVVDDESKYPELWRLK